MTRPLRIVVIGLSLSSSWGNGHATTYRALLRALARRGHDILFLEHDQPWYAGNRDLADPEFCRLALYSDRAELERHRDEIASADAVIVGSYVTDGAAVAAWAQDIASGITAFYDIDTPVTLSRLDGGDLDYLTPDLIPRFDLYLSFTGGSTLDRLVGRYGAAEAHPLYCSVDTEAYRPRPSVPQYDLGYLGTYSADRQPTLDRLLLASARAAPDLRFVVAGSQYPRDMDWPRNVTRIEHVPPQDHVAFYTSCRFTLNVTREDMIRAGYSPSVRLFEAAACGVPIVSDHWKGIETIFDPETEIVLARETGEVLDVLTGWPEQRRRDMGAAARRHVLAEHSSDRRAEELEGLLLRRIKDVTGPARLPVAAAASGSAVPMQASRPRLRLVK